MRTFPIALACIAALLAVALPAHALPPCTCDPGPWNCLFTDGSAPPPGCEPLTVPHVPDVSAPELGDLDPRDWPCTCDPWPSPW